MKLPFRRAAAAAPTVDASVDTGTVRQRFNFDWAMSDPIDGLDTYWWWAVSIRVDPSEVIAEDEEGNLWSVPFSTDGEDAVTFGDPVRVRETFVPVSAGEGVAATALVARRRQRVLATAMERPDKPERNNQAASERPDAEEAPPMDASVLQALARLHGLDPETATEDDVNAAVLAAAEADPADPGREVPEADDPDNPEPEAEEPHTPGSETPNAETPAPEPVAASTAPAAGTVVVDEQRLASLEAEAADRRDRERTTIIDAAIADGRFAPSRRDHYEAAYQADPEGTRHLLTATAAEGGLAPDTIPTRLRGTATTNGTDPGLDSVRASMGLPARKES